ncbi:Neuroligin-1 [Eumeta japonica]|uniref:Neuroligin-1 n=1 Tax=Eumeta variegata TaxID=151549 RepID=A0A4C1XQ90_EUMVA|nr:Neuroligin-1 [Eumeta japonica]
MITLQLLYFITLPTLTAKFLVMGESSAGEKTAQPLMSSRVVRTKNGDIRGFIVSPESRFLEPVEVFRGVPYASPPVGSLRFMPPVSGAQWAGVKVAEEFGPVCPQVLPDIRNETAVLKRISKGRLEYLKRILPFLTNQSEDCLYLNIYAPAQEEITREWTSRFPIANQSVASFSFCTPSPGPLGLDGVPSIDSPCRSLIRIPSQVRGTLGRDSAITTGPISWAGPSRQRKRRRPNARWADDITKVAGFQWIRAVEDREYWSSLVEALTFYGEGACQHPPVHLTKQQTSHL